MKRLRPNEIRLGGRALALPVFFPSISTVKTALSPMAYVAVLHSLGEMNAQFLVSALDLVNAADAESLRKSLAAACDRGVTVVMDSGNYESYWKNARGTWKQSDFHGALRRFSHSFALAFDEQDPPNDVDAHVQLVVERWRQDQAATVQPVVPIVHGDPGVLPALCGRVAKTTGLPMIAVPERDLGDGVVERARSVVALRRALDGVGHSVALHLLGTGNPISIALYVWAGADSFDGLEWCQTVVDHDTALLYHLSHADFFRAQTRWGKDDLSFHARTLAHNLAFYADWMRRLRRASVDGGLIEFCRLNFPERMFGKCCAELGWEVPA